MQDALDFIGLDSVKFEIGNARFFPNNITFKVDVSTVTEEGTVLTKETESYKRNCRRYGLKPESLGETFYCYRWHKKMTIYGLSTRSHKYPILCKGPDNRIYKYSAEMIKKKGF